MSMSVEHCWLRTPQLEVRPWQRSDQASLQELSADPGCRAPWGLFKAALPAERAGFWIEQATEAMRTEFLGSWAVVRQNGIFIGCLNYVPRWLDQEEESLPVLELRFRQNVHGTEILHHAVSTLLDFIEANHQPEFIYLYLADQDPCAAEIVEWLGMEKHRTAQYEKVPVEVYRLAPGNRPAA